MSSLRKILEQNKEIELVLLEYLEEQYADKSEEKFNALLQLLDKYEIKNKKNSFTTILRLFTEININHHRAPDFFAKFSKLLQALQADINRHYTNIEIFDIFQKSRRLILFLINSQILQIDEKIYFKYLQQSKSFQKYLEKEFCNFLNEPFKTEDENYDEKRLVGENDSYICKLIRQDSATEFIGYVNQTNYSLDNLIEPTIYETNSYLIDKTPRLIEYVVFFGSIQIFRYLIENNVKLNANLWNYAIHSNNPEIINFLEEYEIIVDDFSNIAEESIKCHHHNITEYICNNHNANPEFSCFFQCFNFFFDLSLVNNFALFKFLYEYDCLDSPLSFLQSDSNINVNQRILN